MPPLIAALLLAAVASLPHYAVRGSVDRTRGTIDVDATITLPAPAAETRFVLGSTYAVRRMTASADATVTVTPDEDFQRIVLRTARPGIPVTLRIRYDGPLAPSGTPPLNIVRGDLVELNLDSLWVPLAEGFTTKFTADATIAGIPRALRAVSSGTVTQSRNRVTLHRASADIDIAFAAMEGFQRVVEPGLEIYAADPSSATAASYRRHGAAAIRFLEQWFGPMPVRPVRIAVVKRERISGYARPGYIVVTDRARPNETGTGKFIAHELAHAWWSPVDPTTEHRWLQESIAEYVALRYVESAFGTGDRDTILERKRRDAANATPLLGRGARTDAELYAKGPLLLFELENRIGRDSLDRVLHNLAAHPPRETSEFLAELERVAGADAARAFDERLRQ